MHLVFDIDETLIFSDYKSNEHEIVGDMTILHYEDQFIVFRPYLEELLDFCFNNFTVSFSTRMTKDRCDFVLKHMLKDNYNPKIIRTREDCYEIQLPYSNIERRKKAFDEDVIWIDDAPEYIDVNDEYKQEIIKAPVFDGDIVDNYLNQLIEKLKLLN